MTLGASLTNPLLLLLMGAVASLAAAHLAIWLGRRSDRLSFWIALWCANTVVVIGSHYFQYVALDGARALLGARISWASALFLAPLMIGITHAVVGERPPRGILRATVVITALIGACISLTPLGFTGGVTPRIDALSGWYLAADPGPLQPVAVPLVLVVFVYCVRVVWRARRLGVWERRVFLGGFLIYAGAALNDALHAARFIQTARVFDFAFVGVAMGLSYFLVRRYNRVYNNLEEEVAARTAEHAALVRAGRFVLGGLDLDDTLTRIVEEAARFAGTPHVKLLLVDKDAGVLRLVAIAGATAPKNFTVPFGKSYSGTVAATGETMFVADTQNDPQNLLAQRDREQGIRTYLGLPVRFENEVVGVLTLNTEASSPWTADQLASLGSFADVAAVAIGNARLYAAATNQGQRLAALADLTQSLTSTLALDQVLDGVVRHAVALFEPAVARLWLLDEGGQMISLRAHAGVKAEVGGVVRMAVGEGLMGSVVASRAPLVVDDIQEDSRSRNSSRIRAEGTVSFAGVPLLLGDRIFGALGLALSKRHRFAPEELGLLQTLAGHAAVAIENARLFEAAQEQARELTALDEVRTALTSTVELAAVLESIGEWAIKLIGADGSAVFELDERAQVLNPRTSRDLAPTKAFVQVPLKVGQGAAGMAAIRRAPVWSADIAAHPLPGYDDAALDDGRLLAAVVANNAYRAVLAIPVMSRETVLGAICLYWNAIHEPTAREIRVLTAFAQQAAVALENARLFASLGERLTRQQTLTRLTRLISGSLDTPTVLAEISRAAARILDSPLALFWVVDRERMTLQFSESSDSVLAADFPLRQVRFDEGVVGWIAAHRQPLAVADVFTDSRFRAHDWWRRHGLKSFYGLPVMLEGVLLAVLTFNSRQPFELTPGDQDILDSFVAQAALAIHNATLFEDEARARREVELALAQVKQLQGMLPICAYCKKIRNDANYWETIEGYIGERSAATFSHGICPDCRDKVVGPEMERWKRSQQGP